MQDEKVSYMIDFSRPFLLFVAKPGAGRFPNTEAKLPCDCAALPLLALDDHDAPGKLLIVSIVTSSRRLLLIGKPY